MKSLTTGPALWAMKMRFNVERRPSGLYNNILKYDILELDIELGSRTETGLYLLLSAPSKSRDFIKVLPLKEYFENSDCCNINIPAVSMPNEMISGLQKKESGFILFFLNNDNPHIKKAIGSYFKK